MASLLRRGLPAIVLAGTGSALLARFDHTEAFTVATDDTAHSLRVLHDTVRRHGALTACVYATGEDVLAAARATALEAGVHLSENLTADVFPNQSAAFSDFHGKSANPAANATLTDPAFVTGRFAVLQSRRHAPAR